MDELVKGVGEEAGVGARDSTGDGESGSGSGGSTVDGSTVDGSTVERAPETLRTFRIVRVVSVEVNLPDQFPTVILEDLEADGGQLSFRIGAAEGVAMAHALASTAAPRPSTHDLFASVLARFGVDVLAVRLVGRAGQTYFAEMELAGPGGSELLPCRPSDGICMALRQRVPAPVLCDARLFTTVGDVHSDEPAADGT